MKRNFLFAAPAFTGILLASSVSGGELRDRSGMKLVKAPVAAEPAPQARTCEWVRGKLECPISKNSKQNRKATVKNVERGN